jgi:hypothetical protein
MLIGEGFVIYGIILRFASQQLGEKDREGVWEQLSN